MALLHLCNAFFEKEIEESVFGGKSRPLKNWFSLHPMFLQLQFLPLLYAEEDDVIFVSHLPENPDPRLRLIDEGPFSGKWALWGSSLSFKEWCRDYEIPDWEVVKKVNSKIFSLLSSPRLEGAALLEEDAQVLSWIEKTPGPKVLKTAYGTAGRGHFHVGIPCSIGNDHFNKVGASGLQQQSNAETDHVKDMVDAGGCKDEDAEAVKIVISDRARYKKGGLESFLKRQFTAHLPVLGEPWVERVLDFSTQWVIGEEISFLGSTIFENQENGSYLATFAGKSLGDFQWAFDEHYCVVKPLLHDIQKLGFFGNLGVDAFVYLHLGKLRLHPVVEINARKTMSWVALQVREKYFPENAIRFSFEKGIQEGILPQKLRVDGKEICFSHQIRYTPIF